MTNYYRFHLPFQNYRPYRKIAYYPNQHQNINSFINKDNVFHNYSNNLNNNFKNRVNMNNINNNNIITSNNLYNKEINCDTLKSNSKFFSNNKNKEKGKFSKNLPPNSDFVLDLFGLHLYFDDVLILGLLFFLYKENVKDEGLFLALIMLLIS